MVSQVTAATSNTGLDLAILAQYGLPGALLISIIQLCRWFLKRESDRSIKIETELKALQTRYLNEFVPLIIASTEATKAATEAISRGNTGRHS